MFLNKQKLKFSKYQEEIFKEFSTSNKNILINAVAGSGKSTTLLHLLKLCKKTDRVQLCAFNKSIAEEFKTKCNGLTNVEINTIHSIGYRYLSRRGKRVVSNFDKYYKILQTELKNKKLNLVYEETNGIIELVNYLRFYFKETLSDCEWLCINFDIRCNSKFFEIALSVLKKGREDLSEIDFTDMVYLPVYHKNIVTRDFKYVFVDECQDLNVIQRMLVEKIVTSNGKMVFVGDEKQAIYGFAGSNINSFKEIACIPNTVQLPLSINYRCGKLIINHAKKLVPILETFDTQIPGEIKNSSYKDIIPGDMVLCRINAPLISLCIKFIVNKKKAYVKGRDIGENLSKLLNVKKYKTIAENISKLKENLNKLGERLADETSFPIDYIKRKHTKYLSEKDKLDGIIAISDGLVKTEDVILRIKEVFKEEGEGIILSSVHKAKGLENNNVFILSSGYFSSLKGDNSWKNTQEDNLDYVARTRAKKFLGYIIDFGPMAYGVNGKNEEEEDTKVVTLKKIEPKEEKKVEVKKEEPLVKAKVSETPINLSKRGEEYFKSLKSVTEHFIKKHKIINY